MSRADAHINQLERHVDRLLGRIADLEEMVARLEQHIREQRVWVDEAERVARDEAAQRLALQDQLGAWEACAGAQVVALHGTDGPAAA